MNLTELCELRQGLEALANNNSVNFLSRSNAELLAKDLQRYIDNHGTFQPRYHEAWNWTINQRVAKVLSSQTGPLRGDIMALQTLCNANQPEGATAITQLLFGQRRCEFKFADHDHDSKPEEVTGNQIIDVARKMHHWDQNVDAHPLQVFLHGNDWVTINNRGYTMMSLAGVQPTRFLPTKPEQKKLNRLSDASIAQDLNYDEIKWPKAMGVNRAKLKKLLGTTMPSRYIAVTMGSVSNSKVVFVAEAILAMGPRTIPEIPPAEFNNLRVTD